MIGSPDSTYGSSAKWSGVVRERGSLRSLASFGSGTEPTLLRRILVVAARLRRLTNETVATSIAHHAQQASLLAQQHPERLQLYRGPLDQLFAWAAARFDKRPRGQA